MKHISKFLFIIIIIVNSISLNAQQKFKGEPLKLDPATSRYVRPASVKGWIQLREDAPYVASLIFEEAPQLLGMQADDKMRIFKMNTDVVGNRHYKYAQYYKGIRVEGIEQIVHEKNNRVYHLNGDFIPDLHLDVVPSITAEQAIQTALHAVPAQKYLWEEEKNRLWFQYKKKDPEASLYPQPELLIVKRDAKDKASTDYVLAWRMVVHTQIPRSSIIVHVDAQEGGILRKRNAEKMCDPPLVPVPSCWTVYNTWQLYCAATSHNGTQIMTLHNENCDDENTRSDDGCFNGSEVWSRDYNTGDTYCGLQDTYYGGTASEIMGASAMWTMRQVMIFFIVAHDHEGFSGTGDIVDVFNDVTFYDAGGDPYYTGSSFDPTLDNIYLGRGATSSSSTDDYNTLDIVGHEFTHGIINDAHFDDLDDNGEAGAVNEALCDFFGEICGPEDWLIAGEKSDGALRSFSNPNSYGDPDTYQGTYWYSGSGDNGGVHTNCGVMNYCLYLMTEGGSGTNDLGYDYDVTALPGGIYSSRIIAWQAMMNYIDGSDDFEIVRNCFIQAAMDLYGSCSDEVLTVCEAFNAVGISHYTPFNLASMCGTYSSPVAYTIDAVDGVSNASVSNYNFSTACTTTITSSGNVIAESGSYIQLKPGFTATSGCTFTAQIEPCSITEYNPNNLKQPFHAVHENNFPQEEATLNPLSIYPNPSDESFIAEFTLESETQVSMYVMDVTGRTVMHLKDNEMLGKGKQNLEVNTSALAPSAYLLVMQSSGRPQMAKFIVQH